MDDRVKEAWMAVDVKRVPTELDTYRVRFFLLVQAVPTCSYPGVRLWAPVGTSRQHFGDKNLQWALNET